VKGRKKRKQNDTKGREQKDRAFV